MHAAALQQQQQQQQAAEAERVRLAEAERVRLAEAADKLAREEMAERLAAYKAGDETKEAAVKAAKTVEKARLEAVVSNSNI